MRDYLGKFINVTIDRQLGSTHPKYHFVYTLNYRYLPNTIAGDGEEIDVYIIDEFKPLDKYSGYVVAIIERKNDIEDKLVICKHLTKYSKEQIKVLVEFQERFFESNIIMNKL